VEAPDVTNKSSFAQGQLKSIVERIERLEEEKKTIAADIKEVYAEAKGNGFDTKVLRKVISLRKKDANEREEEEAMLDLYLQALGMLPGETEEAASAASTFLAKASQGSIGFELTEFLEAIQESREGCRKAAFACPLDHQHIALAGREW
jgi:uncharacterized protein (UPF0335 family)